jgi:hypothetical protein
MLLLICQLTAASAESPIADIAFDLAEAKSARVEAGAIVVTGRKQSPRIEAILPTDPEPLLPRVEAGLFGNVRAAVETQQHMIGPGVASNRLMLSLKLPF